jgi:zinc D-Ala-D-Ala carboxypeptidase
LRSRVAGVGAFPAFLAVLAGCAFGQVVAPTPDPSLLRPSLAAHGPGESVAPAPTGVPLPRCRYADVPVQGDPASDWSTIVVDTIYRLPKRYAPEDLAGTGKAGLNGGYQVARVVIADLREMAAAARDAGVAFAVQSAYRSYQYQVSTYQGWVARSSEAEARKVSARAGHSEHQLGTALDLRSADDPTPPWELDDFAATPAGGWLHDHAWQYGFVMSYPRGAADETCYAYEPWHYRYVGRDVAAAIHESGQAPRRYLWETYGPGSR